MRDTPIRRLTRGCCIVIARGSDDWRLGAVSLLRISSGCTNYSLRSNLRFALTISSADGGEWSG
jgi:hypothetical protein